MKKLSVILFLIAVSFGLLQLTRPDEPEYQAVSDLKGIPEEVNEIIRTACFDCHSTQTELRWYDKLAPASYFVYNHILSGRKALDFSKWDSLPPAVQNAKLYYAVNKILEGEMPLPSYTAVHPKAKISAKNITTLKHFLLTRTPRAAFDSTQIRVLNQHFSDWVKAGPTTALRSVQPAPNGIEYIPDYRDWKVISISDRFDNGTMRIIYGNGIAVKAIQEHHTNPWPDGATFAKTAWKQQANSDGSVTTGQFVQVEFMIKDAQKYAGTAGWGWARWLGADLKPYGQKAVFTAECISCHQPMKTNDYVFTKPLFLKEFIQKTNNNQQ